MVLAAALLPALPASGADVLGLAARFRQALAGGAPVRVLHYGDSHLVASRRMYGSLLRSWCGDGGYAASAVNGSKASRLLELPEAAFEAQVRAGAPDLVILAFGTNEANDARLDPVAYRRGLEKLVERFRRAAPAAALLFVGPPDGRLPHAGPAALDAVVGTQREVAARSGAIFVDQRRAMGGPGSVRTWQAQGLAGRDLVHMTGPGYERLARAVLGQVLDSLGQGGALPARLPAAPPEAGRTPARSAPTAPERRPIYVFRAEDGRVFITDDPSQVRGRTGEWVGRVPPS